MIRVRAPRIPAGVADGMLAVAFGAAAVIERLTPHIDIKAGPLGLDVPMTVTVIGLLALRRVAPVRVLLLSSAVVAVPTFFVHHDFLFWSHMLPLAIQTYTVARMRGARVGAVAALAPIAAVSIVFTLDGQAEDLGSAFFVLFFAFAVAAGATLRRNALQRAALADALRRLDAERSRRERFVVAQERVRVARDLQTIVAHAVSLMLVQAEAAASLATSDPRAAEGAVRALEAAGRSATGELRRMLGLLRAHPAEADRSAPMPGLGSLDDLIEQMQHAGLEVQVVVTGSRPALPPGFDVTAYRIVQEALTNVLKHAGPTRVQLQVRYGHEVALDVVDAGPADHARHAASAAGHGLIGMRERVSLLGGELSASPEEAGFAVRVRLPVPARA